MGPDDFCAAKAWRCQRGAARVLHLQCDPSAIGRRRLAKPGVMPARAVTISASRGWRSEVRPNGSRRLPLQRRSATRHWTNMLIVQHASGSLLTFARIHALASEVGISNALPIRPAPAGPLRPERLRTNGGYASSARRSRVACILDTVSQAAGEVPGVVNDAACAAVIAAMRDAVENIGRDVTIRCRFVASPGEALGRGSEPYFMERRLADGGTGPPSAGAFSCGVPGRNGLRVNRGSTCPQLYFTRSTGCGRIEKVLGRDRLDADPESPPFSECGWRGAVRGTAQLDRRATR